MFHIQEMKMNYEDKIRALNSTIEKYKDENNRLSKALEDLKDLFAQHHEKSQNTEKQLQQQ